MRTYTAAELREILNAHTRWYYGHENGRRANLCGADLRDADLRGADLCGADLRDADLRGADLCGADLRDAKYNERTTMYALACPEVGAFIGWKKARGYIVKLEITSDAMRSSATTRKCRCSKANVLAIENIDGTESCLSAIPSDYDNRFTYEVGKTVSVGNFDTNRWNECAPGIHFFITRDEAVRY